MQCKCQAKSLSQKILSTLAESPIPVTTPDLIAIVATGLSHPRQRVWTQLRRLYHAGLIQCQTGRTMPTKDTDDNGRKMIGHRIQRWRLAS